MGCRSSGSLAASEAPLHRVTRPLVVVLALGTILAGGGCAATSDGATSPAVEADGAPGVEAPEEGDAGPDADASAADRVSYADFREAAWTWQQTEPAAGVQIDLCAQAWRPEALSEAIGVPLGLDWAAGDYAFVCQYDVRNPDGSLRSSVSVDLFLADDELIEDEFGVLARLDRVSAGEEVVWVPVAGGGVGAIVSGLSNLEGLIEREAAVAAVEAHVREVAARVEF